MTISNRKLSLSSVASVLALVGIAAFAGGCSSETGGETVGATLTVLDRSSSALAAGTITSINGTYGSACGGHNANGLDTWSLAAGATTLAVAKNDTDCVLTIANIVTAGATYAGTPAIALDTSNAWEATPSVFAADGEASFYANAKISALTFSANFGITLLVSDTQAAASSNKAAAFGTVNGSVTSSTVPAPDYTISMSGMDIEKDADAVVVAATGFAQLGEEAVAGQDYAVHLGSLTSASTIQEMSAAFAGATSTGTLASLTTLQVPASMFELVGLDLDTSTVRTVIVRNLVDGVPSYQLFTITFTP